MNSNSDFRIIRLETRIKRLEKTIEDTKDERDKALTQLKESLFENKRLKKQLDQPNVPNDGYKSDSTWISKIVFLVTIADKPLRSVEIIALLITKEPVLKTKSSKEKFVSAFLNIAMRYQRLIPFKLKGVRGNYYCLPEWMNDKNELLLEIRKKIY